MTRRLESTAARPARVVLAPTVALVVALVGFTAYTVEAFQLEWLTARGNIGSGSFPRLIGIAGIVASATALVQGLRRQHAGGTSGQPDQDDHGPRARRATLVAVASSVLLVAMLEVLGALVAGFLFLLVNLEFLDRGRRMVNLVVAIGFVAGAYGLMSVFLDAPWAVGLLGF
ncbi:tripartite tricarboxylate transporter TctB family protein [Pseudonocardia adelaidensis]|uniref:DUF1468 domain-containing protein n=1 Tax=Pseudonocardia adelaidensis TaxID=648754 RepID=A0ABP9NLB9_9PSEU